MSKYAPLMIFLCLVTLVIGGILTIVHFAGRHDYAGDSPSDARSFVEERLTKDYTYAGQWQFVSQTHSQVLGHNAWKIQYSHGTSNVCYYEWVDDVWRRITKGQC